MAKVLTNKHQNTSIFFSDDFEMELLELKNCNMHDEVRMDIAKILNLSHYVKRFSNFANLPFKTFEQMTEREELTKEFLCTIDFLYGRDAVTYLTQFL